MYSLLSSEWSLFKMFSRTLTEACPLASSSKIYIDVTDNPQVAFCSSTLNICISFVTIQTSEMNLIKLSKWSQTHLTEEDISPPPFSLNLYKNQMVSFLQEDQFELSPATHLLSQAVVLGDRRTFSVYDLTQQVTFGTVRSLNVLIRWKSTEGEWQKWWLKQLYWNDWTLQLMTPEEEGEFVLRRPEFFACHSSWHCSVTFGLEVKPIRNYFWAVTLNKILHFSTLSQ